MSSGYHRLGANAGKAPGFSNAGIVNLHRVIPYQGSHETQHGIPPAARKVPDVSATLLDSERAAVPAMGRAQALQSGFTGDQCSNCNSMRMKISGHCMVCEDCGTTTGCS